MTNLDKKLSELETLCEAATEGPWVLGDFFASDGSHKVRIFSKEAKTKFHSQREIALMYMWSNWSQAIEPDAEGYNCWGLPYKENAKFIAQSRDAMPKLIKALRKAIEGIDNIEGTLFQITQPDKGDLFGEVDDIIRPLKKEIQTILEGSGE